MVIANFLFASAASFGQEHNTSDISKALSITSIEPGKTALVYAASSKEVIEEVSRQVGDQGMVYAHFPQDLSSPTEAGIFEEIQEFVTSSNLENVSLIARDSNNIGLHGKVDIALFCYTLHEMVHATNSANVVSFFEHMQSNLTENGEFLIVEHQGNGLEMDVENHRIEKQLLIQLLNQSGIQVIEDSPIFANPDDPKDVHILAPQVRGNTDRMLILATGVR